MCRESLIGGISGVAVDGSMLARATEAELCFCDRRWSDYDRDSQYTPGSRQASGASIPDRARGHGRQPWRWRTRPCRELTSNRTYSHDTVRASVTADI